MSSPELLRQLNQSTWPLGEQVSEWDFGAPRYDDGLPKQSILSLDDGGIRGYVSLQFLTLLMSYIDRWERLRDEQGFETLTALPPSAEPGPLPLQVLSKQELHAISTHIVDFFQGALPSQRFRDSRPLCEYFDFIGGSGTGG